MALVTTMLSTVIGGAETFTSITISGLTASRAVVTDAGKTLASSATTATELGYVSGVTSAIQTQINAKLTGTAASQTDQETGSSTTAFVASGVQQYHPSSVKAWCMADIIGGIALGYNMTSVTDAGVGQIVFNWNVDFSTANYTAIPSVYLAAANVALRHYAAPTAGTASIICTDLAGTPTDPINWFIVASGDQ